MEKVIEFSPNSLSFIGENLYNLITNDFRRYLKKFLHNNQTIYNLNLLAKVILDRRCGFRADLSVNRNVKLKYIKVYI